MIRYVMLANKNFKDINPLDCGEEICSADFIRKNRIFKYYLLHFAFKGSGIFEYNGVKHRLEKDCISIIRPNQFVTYYADAADPWHYSWIGFECSAELPFSDEDVILRAPQARKIFKELIASDKIMYGRENFVCSKIHELFAILQQNKNGSRSEQQYYADLAKNYIENYYNIDISLDRLAKELMISKSYFCQIFKKHVGMSPYNYVIKTRLDNAVKMLALHNLPVKTIAIDVGFPDAATFSKCFKKFFGFSPSEIKGKRLT